MPPTTWRHSAAPCGSSRWWGATSRGGGWNARSPAASIAAGLVRPAGFRTPVKTRILAGGIHSAKQQVVRIDRLSSRPVTDDERAAVARAAHAAVKDADAVLISDYGSGLVTPALAREIWDGVRSRQIPVLVDSRYALTRYRGLTACAPNESEVERALDVRIDDNLRVLERAGRRILARTRMKAVIVTRGSRGMAVFEPGKKTVHIPIFGSDQIADVTGAGDTVMATLTLALAAGTTVEEAARLANVAGGLVVMKRGTATVSAAELRRAAGSLVSEWVKSSREPNLRTGSGGIASADSRAPSPTAPSTCSTLAMCATSKAHATRPTA